MKKIIAAILLGAMLAVPVYARDKTVEIIGVTAENGLITVEAVNKLEAPTRITFEIINQTEGLSEEQSIYALGQVIAEGEKSVIFNAEIMDDRNGIPGTGTYIVEVENGNEDRDSITFDYADGNTIAEFMSNLKGESEKITDSEKAYEKLLPLFTASNSKGIFFSIGLDYEEFSNLSADVQKEMMNLLYEAGIENADEISTLFKAVYSLAIYNSGAKLEAVSIINPTYGGEAVDKDVAEDAVDYMEKAYDNSEALKKAFIEAYGIETVNRANSNGMKDALETFRDETGLLKSDINKINNLSSARAYAAYDYIVTSCKKNKLKTTEELEELLGKAYNKATEENKTSGGGGGGGAAGGVSNSIPSKTTYASAVQGSGGIDEKKEATNIFADLSLDHWAAEAVDFLKKAGVVNGNEKGEFEPDRNITREEFAKMLVSICGLETDGIDTAFTDVERNGWYRKYIGAAADAGIVNGIGDGKFGVGSNIIRQDMAVMTKRAVEYKEKVLTEMKEYNNFADENDISDYAKESITELYKAGVINGKGGNMFEPFGNATRAEAAKIIYEAFKGGE